MAEDAKAAQARRSYSKSDSDVWPAPPQPEKPFYPSPHSFLALALVFNTICEINNILTLGIGIPAVVFAIRSMRAAYSGNYPKAKDHANLALALTIGNIVLTLFLNLLITGIAAYSDGFENTTKCSYVQYDFANHQWYCRH